MQWLTVCMRMACAVDFLNQGFMLLYGCIADVLNGTGNCCSVHCRSLCYKLPLITDKDRDWDGSWEGGNSRKRGYTVTCCPVKVATPPQLYQPLSSCNVL
jgi:hypothetical protein